MTRQAAGAMDSAGMEPKQMSTGLATMSAVVSRTMTLLVKAIELHEETWIPPLPGTPTVRCLDLDSPQMFGGAESKAKNSKVEHEHTEYREHDEFILVRASGE
jgi:hypothetical protein